MTNVTPAPKPAPAKKNGGAPAANAAPFVMLGAIPVPPSKRRGFDGPKYPWGDLKIGGAPFFVPGATARNFSSRASVVGKRLGGKFTVRDHEHQGVKGVAVWRVEGTVTTRGPRKPKAAAAPAAASSPAPGAEASA